MRVLTSQAALYGRTHTGAGFVGLHLCASAELMPGAVRGPSRSHAARGGIANNNNRDARWLLPVQTHGGSPSCRARCGMLGQWSNANDGYARMVCTCGALQVGRTVVNSWCAPTSTHKWPAPRVFQTPREARRLGVVAVERVALLKPNVLRWFVHVLGVFVPWPRIRRLRYRHVQWLSVGAANRLPRCGSAHSPTHVIHLPVLCLHDLTMKRLASCTRVGCDQKRGIDRYCRYMKNRRENISKSTEQPHKTGNLPADL